MRKFYLHTYDGSKTFDLNGKNAFAAEPKGLGNAFALSYKDSDKGKHLVNVTPSFENIRSEERRVGKECLKISSYKYTLMPTAPTVI